MPSIQLKPALVTTAAALFLAGCETAEQIEARQTQFNGMPLNDVIATIGEPRSKSSKRAVWHYTKSGVNFQPIYGYRANGQAYVIGHNRVPYTLTCTYTANLQSGKVVESIYDGNGCSRYAPKLKT